MKEKIFTKKRVFQTIWRLVLILVGSTITAAGITYLLEPHNLLTGGVTGISLLLSYFTPVEPGIYVMLLNIPLFILAWRKIDLHFCVYSIIGVTTLSAMMIVFHKFPMGKIVSDPMLAVLFGGMISGAGTGLVIRARASHGGTDIVSVVLRQKFSMGIGMVTLYINIILDAVLALKFGLEIALLTLFGQFVASIALDRVVTGFNTAKAVTIVSDKAPEIAEYIMTHISRGVTFLKGEGAYQKEGKQVIWCVVTTSQLSGIKGAMKHIDPAAFMAISDANEVIGSGFYRAPF